jgi:hypothetical protein
MTYFLLSLGSDKVQVHALTVVSRQNASSNWTFQHPKHLSNRTQTFAKRTWPEAFYRIKNVVP